MGVAKGNLAALFAMVLEPKYASGIVNAAVALTPLWGVALSLLAINVVKRPQDKAVTADAGQPVELMAAAAQPPIR